MSKIVERTLDFLELFADRKQPLLLSDISKILAIPASSCHDVLQALVQRGYIYELAPRAGYYPTLRLFDVAKAIADNDPVVRRAEHILRALKDVVGETVLLSKTSGTTSTYLLAFEPAHRLRFTVSLGDSFSSLYATSGGKAQLSCWSDAALEAHLKDVKLAQLTSKTITSIRTLRAEILAGRERGWFLNNEESIEGVVTISAPFLWSAAVYIVTIAGPTARLEPKLDRAVDELLQACRSLEKRLTAQ
jgi:DNA-binding IclR family transcriptional regulator